MLTLETFRVKCHSNTSYTVSPLYALYSGYTITKGCTGFTGGCTCSPYTGPRARVSLRLCRNEVGLFPSLIQWPISAIRVCTLSLANESPSRGRMGCHTTPYQERGASRATQPTVNLRCEIERRLRVGLPMRHTSSQANTQHEARERCRAGGHRTRRGGSRGIAVRHHPGCETRQTTSRCPAFPNQRRRRYQNRQVCHMPSPVSPRRHRQLLSVRPSETVRHAVSCGGAPFLCAA